MLSCSQVNHQRIQGRPGSRIPCLFDVNTVSNEKLLENTLPLKIINTVSPSQMPTRRCT